CGRRKCRCLQNLAKNNTPSFNSRIATI
ncbi:uncharacterized protein METZ01_LOCUS216821, partial [marine metagenome]